MFCAPDAQAHQQVEAGERGGAGARTHELDLVEFLAHHAQAVQYRRADDDRGAVLVVVEDRDLHALPAQLFDDEALGGLDVLEIDAAERGFERDDHVDQLVRVAFVDLDIETVDAGEFLEQHRLAFHHRLGGERADRAESEHRGTVGDHADQVAARREIGHLGRVAHDLVACRGDTRRVGERQVTLVGKALGGGYRDLARRMLPMIFERGFADVFVRHEFFWRQARGSPDQS